MPQRKALQMSPELNNLIESIKLIASVRANTAGISYAWDKLYNAGQYLQAQVKPLIEE